MSLYISVSLSSQTSSNLSQRAQKSRPTDFAQSLLETILNNGRLEQVAQHPAECRLARRGQRSYFRVPVTPEQKERVEALSVSSGLGMAALVGVAFDQELEQDQPVLQPTGDIRAGQIQIPRFLHRTLEGGAVEILDRGERAEHLANPLSVVQLQDHSWLERLFPDAVPWSGGVAHPEVVQKLERELAGVRFDYTSSEASLSRTLRDKQRLEDELKLASANPNSYLEALRLTQDERDKLKARVSQLEEHLQNFQSEDQVIYGKQAHFRKRLLERFGIELSRKNLLYQQEQADKIPIFSYTYSGSPVKLLRFGEQSVYAIVTPVGKYPGILTTAFTEEMLRSSEFLED